MTKKKLVKQTFITTYHGVDIYLSLRGDDHVFTCDYAGQERWSGSVRTLKEKLRKLGLKGYPRIPAKGEEFLADYDGLIIARSLGELRESAVKHQQPSLKAEPLTWPVPYSKFGLEDGRPKPNYIWVRTEFIYKIPKNIKSILKKQDAFRKLDFAMREHHDNLKAWGDDDA